MELPIAPSKLTIKIKNQNETVSLINEGEINILKSPGLSEISFDFILPAVPYPFAHNPGDISGYLSYLEGLKVDEEPFQFIVSRFSPNGEMMWDTNIPVSLEDYSIKEDSGQGRDLLISVSLKQYREWGSKTIKIKQSGGKSLAQITENKRTTKLPEAKGTLTQNSTLANLCREETGGQSDCYDVAKKNGISNPNLFEEGQVLIF